MVSSGASAWYRDERLLIPLAILVAGIALLLVKPLLTQPVLRQTLDASLASTAATPAPSAPQVRPNLPALPPVAAPVQYTDLNGVWSGRYEQIGDAGDFSEFRITQQGRRITGEGATRSQALNDTARYTIEGSIDGMTVRFTDHLAEPKLFWCEDCQYVGTVNEDYTRIELRATCPGLCPGGTMVLERFPPDQPPLLL